MPAVVAKKADAKGKGTEKKKKELPKELCGCGADTYRAPPKGKKAPAPIEHQPGCIYQRTTCDAYPELPRCAVCQSPCEFCGGKNRWCPHCYEKQCQFRYTRVVHGWAPDTTAPPTTGGARSSSKRATTVRFLSTDAPGGKKKKSVAAATGA